MLNRNWLWGFEECIYLVACPPSSACARLFFPPIYLSSKHFMQSFIFSLTFSRLESSKTKKNRDTKLHESYLDIEKKLDEINGNITDRCNVIIGLFDVVLGKGRWMLL